MQLAAARRFKLSCALPGDKSLSHRLAIFGALAEGDTVIDGFSSAGDCASTLRCLEALGVAVERTGSHVVIHGRGWDGLRAPKSDLDCGNSGTTLRLLSGVLAACSFEATLTGDASLCGRPVERVAGPLRSMGAEARSTDGKPPLTLRGGALHGIDCTLPVPSAQVKSAVLLAGLRASGITTVSEPSPSRDHTERLLPAFGVTLQRNGLSVSLQGGQRMRPVTMTVPGDVSSAAFLVVAALICPDSEVRIEGVLLNPLRTAFLDVLRAMGGKIETGLTSESPEPVGWITARSSKLTGTSVGADIVPALIDEVPALAVAAACAQGEFTLSGAKELRVKESDRISALHEGLTRLGADVEERPDGLRIRGGRPLHGAAVRAHSDHRIAMALSIAALVAEGETTIEGADAAAVSFPEFYERLRQASQP
jgi:3-phosphoshikimate 1-carboxyvinyltransferase